MSNIYYVYAYLRKDGTPYYIGKGQGNRYLAKHSINIPKSLDRIVFLETQLSEVGALALERRYILWYGRKDIGTGILRNMTDGGEGSSGRVFSEETRRKISKSSSNNNLRTVQAGTHPFLSKSGISVAKSMAEKGRLHFQTRSKEIASKMSKENNLARLSAGTHNFLDSQKASANNKARVDAGTHNLIGKNVVTLIDKNGNGHRLPVEILNYWKSTNKPMSEWDYVSIASKEAARRRST